MRGSNAATGLLVALAVAACDRGSAVAPAAPVAPVAPVAPAPVASAKRQPFVVAIVVDQLSAWVAQSRWPELPSDGGFARLRREGTWVKNMRYPYAVTDTAPGHTSLHTGKVPAESGIFGNELPEPNGQRVSILRDEAVKPIAWDGVRSVPGSSPARLRVDTVADRLRAASPKALVISVSVKDRGAILPAGRHPTHVLWFDSSLDSFVTSTAFTSTFPSWAQGIGDTRSIVAARSRPWELTDPAWVKAHAAGPDDQPGEGDLEGLGTTFPHVARTPAGFRALPAGDETIVKLALAAVAADYDASRPTLLLLSMSASDVIGHVFGPDSWEAWDHLRKLDATLAMLFDALDRRAGSPVSVLLSGDHGNISMPEIPPERAGVRCPGDPFERPCARGARLGPNALRDELIAATKTALGGGHWVAGLADPYVYLMPEARALPAERRALLDRTIRAALGAHPAVADVLDTRTFATRCPEVLAHARGVPDRARLGEDVLTLVCRAWSPGAGDYYVVPRPGSFFDGEVVIGKGTSHGTPFAYDRTVSMLVRAPGLVPAGEVIEDSFDFSAFSALEAAFIGLDTRLPRDILEAHRAAPAPAKTP
jgi:hypothetical protein